MDRPASPGSRADDRNPTRSWPTGRRSSIREWWSRASRSWTYEEGEPKEEGATAPARPRAVRGQGRYGQRRVDRAETGVLSDPGATRDGSARSPALQRHDLRPGRAVRAAQPPRPELPAAWRARRRRYHLAQDRRPGEGVFHRAPASRAGAPQMSDRVLVALEGGVLTATLNRPEKKNAIDTPMIDALLTLLDQADLDAAVRVVAARGAGSDFCAGMDLNELLASADNSVEENRQAALRFAEIFVRMRRIPKPIVAVVQGRALAGGCGLATACDLVLATESARVGYPEVQRGFVPAIVMTLLKRTAGEKVAFDLAATGRILGASEAAGLGLVSRVYEDSDFEDQVSEVLRALAAASPSALAFTKQQVYRLAGIRFEEGIRLGADVNAVSRTTPDFRAALQAFLKK